MKIGIRQKTLGNRTGMNRKIIVCLLTGSLICIALFAEAQQPKIPRIGFLGGSSASAYTRFIEAFQQGLRDLGYEDARNITIVIVMGRESVIGFPTSHGSWSVLRLMSFWCQAL